MIAHANSVVQLANQIKNRIIKTCQCECKNYHICKKLYSQNPSTCICENGKYFKSVVDDSKIACDEIKLLLFMDIVSRKMTNTISTNASKVILVVKK